MLQDRSDIKLFVAPSCCDTDEVAKQEATRAQLVPVLAAGGSLSWAGVSRKVEMASQQLCCVGHISVWVKLTGVNVAGNESKKIHTGNWLSQWKLVQNSAQPLK